MPNVPPNEHVLKIASGLEGRVRGLAGLSQRLIHGQCTEQDFETAKKLYEHPDSSEAVRERLQILGAEIRARMLKIQQESPDPEAPDDAGLTLGKMDNNFRKSGVKLLQDQIFPFIEREKTSPDFIAKMVRGIEVSPDRSVASLFVNFSAGGRSLLPPLHIVGQALLQARPKISAWVEMNAGGELRSFFTRVTPQEWLEERFTFLEESVRVEQAKIDAEDLLKTFEVAFTSKNRDLLANAQQRISFLFNYNSENRRLRQHTITFIAQMLSEALVMTDSQRYLTRGLLDTFKTVHPASSSEDSFKEMLVAIDMLRKSQQHLDPAQSIPTQTSVHQAPQHVQNEAPAPKLLPPDKNAARLKLQEIMRLPDSKKTAFIQALKTALQPCAHRLAIDLKESSFRVLGAGGTCVVVELHDSTMDRPFAARFDIESIGEGEDAEVATELAMRAFAIHSRLNHHSIVKHIGFDSVPFEMKNRRGKTTVTITFQRLELVDRALSGHSIITSFKEQETVPTSEGAMDVMHKMFVPLEFIHRMGVTHRDIKPDNMMLVPPANWNGDLHTLLKFGTLKFLDIGLARQLNIKEGGATFSSTDIIPGTLPFIAPECFLDGTKTRDQKNDVYALGVTLYHFITGQPDVHPFNVSRGVSIDFSHQSSVISAMGMLAMDVEEGKNPPSVVSLEDPGIQQFLNQNHGGQTGKVRAQKIVHFIMRMGDPNPEHRPTMKECVLFTRSLTIDAPKNGGLIGKFFGRS